MPGQEENDPDSVVVDLNIQIEVLSQFVAGFVLSVIRQGDSFLGQSKSFFPIED